MLRYLLLLTFLALPAHASAAIINVPGDYSIIQDAIDAAFPGDTVLVAAGTYPENIDYKGKAITLISAWGPELTIIDGNQAGSVVTFVSGEGLDSVLDGFTVTNGLAQFGGGTYCINGSPVIRNCVYTENYATENGGGLFAYNADIVIEDNVFAYNTADFSGGGIAGRFCTTPIIRNNAVYGNTALLGAGIFSCCFVPVVENNRIWGNSAVNGGGFYACIYKSTFDNNTVVKNTASNMGGGIMVVNASTITVVNTIFWDNQAVNGPQIAMGTKQPATLDIRYSDVKGGQAQVYVMPGFTLNWGPGMIDADPNFVDGAGNDFHLRYTSPCKDAGDNAASALPAADFEGDPRVAYGTVDLGADEFHPHLYHMGSATPGGSIEVKLTGVPGTAPLGIWLSGGYLDPPLPCQWGDWYLAIPFSGPIDLGGISSPDGVYTLPGVIPSSMPSPYDIFLQALIGNAMSNPQKIAVR